MDLFVSILNMSIASSVLLLLVLLLASGLMSSILLPLIRGSWNFALWVVGI